MVISTLGIAATSQTLASQAAAQILAQGGSAMDAAICANAVLGVVEPMSCGIGGDLFAICWDAASGKLTGINASGWAPAKLHASGMAQSGIHSVTVPGCVDGWSRLHERFGKLRWATLMEPAIHYAQAGFPVTEIIQRQWRESESTLAPALSIDGRAPRVGEVFRNPELAAALRLLAGSGVDAFYRGSIAKALLKTSTRFGGTLAADDLHEYASEWVTPIASTYRGWSIYELPPNGQGMAALEMLNIMEQFPLHQYGAHSPDTWHIKIETQKLAYADLHRHLADPRHQAVPVEALISKSYAAERARLIDLHRASCIDRPGDPLPAKGDTVYLAVVDRDGNIASLIQSIYQSFGSGVVVDGFGFHLHNRGALFSRHPSHPNAVAPRQRPFHTIIPGFMRKGDTHIGFGIMGGFNQAQAHAQFVSNVVDHGMNIQAALEAPRFTKPGIGGCDLLIEARVPESTLNALRGLGHDLHILGDYDSQMGGGQAVLHDSATHVNCAASSPRKGGAAIPQPPLLRQG